MSQLQAGANPLSRQALMILRDMPIRFLAISAICGAATPYLAWPLCLTVWVATCLYAAAGSTVLRRMIDRPRRRDVWLFQALALAQASILVALALAAWNTGLPVARALGLLVLMTIALNAAVMRSIVLPFAATVLLPLTFGVGAIVRTQLDGPVPLRDAAALATVLAATAVYLLACILQTNRTHAALIDARLTAERADRAKGRFLSAISHEIRTPLNGILGMAEVLSRDAETDRERETAAVLLSSGQILKSLTDDVLDHAKIEAGKVQIRPVPTALGPLIASGLNLYRDLARDKGLALDHHLDPVVPSHLRVDPMRVTQILGNLTSNAIKATERGGVRIDVRCEPGATSTGVVLRIAVTDTGIGIAEGDLSRLFKSFEQIETGVGAIRPDGTGLGLSISRGLARAMGGDITVTSATGQGSTFELRIPARICEIEPARDEARAPGKPRLDGLRILLVDDNRTNRMIAKRLLARDGAETDEAGDGLEALRRLDERSYDIVLLDMSMPILDGEGTFERMQERGLRVPVIALTANTDPEDARRYRAMGMAGYFAKPVSHDALRAEILALTGRRPARDAA